MKTPRLQVAEVIAQKGLRAASPKKFGREVAAYLLAEGRVGELDSLLRDIQADWASAGYVEVVAVSAHPLTGKIKDDIKTRVRRIYPAAKKIIIVERCDPEVIGGVRIELADKQLDLSIETKLNKFKQLTAGGD